MAPDTGLGNLDTSTLLPSIQQVDASSMDLSLRAIRNVEAGWTLPPLPDAVKLDLASMPGGPPAVTSLLNGLSSDLNNTNVDNTLPLAPQLSMSSGVATFSPSARSAFDTAQVLLAGLQNDRPPEQVDDFAVQKWKMRAINQGFLPAPENGVVDGSWSPEFNHIRGAMAYSDISAAKAGEHEGAIGIGKTLNMIGDWMSPSGLGRAAMKLDLWWDGGQISKEISSWGDKWRKLGHSKGILDFAGNLLDAVTGPIDDIVIPAVNLALLFTGVGEVMNFARVGMLGEGALAAEAASEAGAIYRLPGLGKMMQSENAAAELLNPAKAGFISSKLSNGGELANKISDGMDAWRNFTPVREAKKVVQVGMRLGFTSQVERKALGYQGNGGNLGDVPGVAQTVNPILNPTGPAGMGALGFAEALLTPFTMFEPGSFMSGARSLGSFAGRQLGTVGGRAIAGAVAGTAVAAIQGSDAGDLAKDAAIGAVAGAALPLAGKVLSGLGHVPILDRLPGWQLVGGVGDFLQKTSWTPITNDQRITNIFHQSNLTSLSGPELEQYTNTFNKHGFQRAAAEAFTGGDVEALGAKMTFVTTSAAIDRTAYSQASSVAQSGTDDWQRAYDLARSKLTAQVRYLDVAGGKDDINDVLWTLTTKNTGNRWAMKDQYDKLLGSVTSQAEVDGVDVASRAAELANHHNIMRDLTLRQLLSPENMPELHFDEGSASNLAAWTGAKPADRLAGLQNYINDTGNSFGNWPKYQSVTSDLDSTLKDGLLLDARYTPAEGWNGQRQNLLPEYDGIPEPAGAQQWGRNIQDHLLLDPKLNMATWASKGKMTPLARSIDSWRGKFTVALKGTVSKQELISASSEMQSHADTIRDFKILNDKINTSTGNTIFQDLGGTGVGGFHDLPKAQFAQGLQDASIGYNDTDRLNRLRTYATRNGLTGADFQTALDAHVSQTLADPVWGDRFNLSTNVAGKDGALLQGESLLRAKALQLTKQANHTAATIDTEHLLAGLAEKYGPKSPEALHMSTVLDSIDAAGYKVVHGAEFLVPHDLLNYSGAFRDMNDRNTNALTLGNFFGKTQPEVLARQVVDVQKASILNQLQNVDHGMNLSQGVDSPDLKYLMHDLYDRVLTPAKERSANSLTELQHESFLAKATGHLQSTGTPFSLQDLGLGKNQKLMTSIMVKAGYSEDVAQAVWRGLKEGRFAEFNELGFAAFEAKLRARNNVADALNVLSGTKPDGGWMPKGIGSAVVGAGVGAVANSGDTGDTWSDALKGAAVGALVGKAGQPLLHAGLSGLADTFETTKWARYGYMADNLAALRDKMRFTLSPMFDLRRYSHSWFLNQVQAGYGAVDRPVAEGFVRLFGKAGEDALSEAAPAARKGASFVDVPKADAVTSALDLAPKYKLQPATRIASDPITSLRFNESPSALKKEFTQEWLQKAADNPGLSPGLTSAKNAASDQFDEVFARFNEAAKGHFDPAEIESTNQYFTRIGLLGYDPTAWQATAWYRLQKSGLSSEDAFNVVKNTLTYGTQGRSAAELSVNFLFFPFSFQKKALGSAAKFLADDFSRGAMIHDAYKMYHILDQEHDIGKRLRDYAPVLDQLQSLNLFSHGISAGQFGGINARLFDQAGSAFVNLFSAQGVSIKNASDALEIQKLGRSLMPVINDVNQLLQNSKEQGHVLFDPSHETTAAEARDGFSAWSDYKKGVYSALQEKGYKPGDLTTGGPDGTGNPQLAGVQQDFKSKRSELAHKYPGWEAAKIAFEQKQVSLKVDAQQRTDNVAAGNASVSDQQFVGLLQYIATLKPLLAQQGITNLADAPPEVLDKIRGVATEMVRNNPNFLTVYQSHFQPEFGPITSPI